MSRLDLTPDASSYAAAPGEEVISVKLDGGASRFRRDQLGAAARVDCQWTLNESQHQYFMAFFRSATGHGADSFEIDLILDGPDIAEYTAHFVPGTLELVGVMGEARIMRAQLEVIPQEEDEDFDESVIMIYDTYGDDAALMLNLLEQLVNVDLPAALGV